MLHTCVAFQHVCFVVCGGLFVCFSVRFILRELLCTVWYSKTRVAESQMGSWEGTRTESQSDWRHCSAPLISSSPFHFHTPPSFPSFNPGVPPLLTLFLLLSHIHLCPPLATHCPPPPPLLFSLANVLGSERIKEAGRETPNHSWASALAWCGGLKNLASWCWFALDTHSLFLLSLSVHIEWLPGSVKGTGRQRSPTSKPSPLAVFSHTIRLQTHIHTHTHAHAREQESQPKSLLGGLERDRKEGENWGKD